ncbi:MAG: YbaB/EbfC family nucleoid-associated protein [Clostridia bacterium]|nr:YbaB/EbfC family nucleoid-associated protein [Clostridia bacterium]
MAGYGRGGFGGGNMQALMKQAQVMQEKMKEKEALLDDWEIVGTAGGEAVVVYMNAKKIINGIELDESVVDPEDVEMLEDLIMAAINDGYAKAEKVYEEQMAEFGGLGGMGGLL